MAKNWSKAWKASKNPSKQRKYQRNAPLHVKHKLMTSPLSKELRKKYGVKRIPVRTGDEVKIMRGEHKGKTGKVTKVLLKKRRIHVSNINLIKSDGSKKPYPIHPSKVLITKLNDEDKKRLKKKVLGK